MFKKTLSVVGIAAALILGSAAAATAYTIPPGGLEASDTTIAPGETITLTVNDIEGETSATFTATGGPSTLASIVLASSTSSSVTKTVADGSASASFTPQAAGEYTVTATGGFGTEFGSVVITVTAPAAAGGTGTLPSTGGSVPAAAIWFGAGALGLGGIAVAAGVARKRASSKV
ncbi:LPXTG cell wall anchor domain-containing protein [Microbacterium allomyrinae]|uniref:LPXTG cell wall anchor domain-containing protein n=1 Tax=Microbacterium allomyrinae TaxID=2830666 RepID=A0A9X1LZJ2_9MICO|nr:LPXTG cell wall anchor domain-containing protein [Microbacterium allomyrinae]MCC2034070.1 LPXTG cell wall anchor domain-containing protein [Microbacterium allomyrinae]